MSQLSAAFTVCGKLVVFASSEAFLLRMTVTMYACHLNSGLGMGSYYLTLLRYYLKSING